jgi:hypothetical protein
MYVLCCVSLILFHVFILIAGRVQKIGVQLIELNRLGIPYIKVLKLKAVLLLKKTTSS